MTPADIHEYLVARLPEAVAGFEAELAQPAILIEAEALVELALLLRDDPQLAFDRLLVISGVDWEGYDENGKGRHRKIAQYGEDGKPEDPGPEGTGDLGLLWYLHSMEHRHAITLKVRMPRAEAVVPSVAAGWATADGESRPRKVRAPQSTTPGNTRAGRPAERATENDCLPPDGRAVRVKRWCKRPPAPAAMPAARQPPSGARPSRSEVRSRTRGCSSL